MANLSGKTLTERIRAAYVKAAGLPKRGRWAFDCWDNDYLQRAGTRAGTSMVDLIGTDARDNLLLGGALQVGQQQLLQYNVQASAKCVTSPFFVNANDITPLEIISISCTFSTANGAAMTAYVSKETAGQAPGAGVSCMSGTFNLNATANTVQNATLAGGRGYSTIVINPGEQLSLKISAAVTSIAGLVVNVWVKPFQGMPPAALSIVANGDIGTAMTIYLNNIPGLTVRGVALRWGTAGSAGTAVTADITKDTSTNAPGAGTSILNAAISVKTTANTTMFPALSATPANLQMAQGDRLCLKMTGTLTSLANLVVAVFFAESAQNYIVISPEMFDSQGVSRTVFISNGFYEFIDAWATWGVASGAGTATFTRDQGTTAPGAGTALLTGTISTAATANTPLEGTRIAVVPTLMLKPGDRLGMLAAGTVGSLANSQVSVTLKKL